MLIVLVERFKSMTRIENIVIGSLVAMITSSIIYGMFALVVANYH